METYNYDQSAEVQSSGDTQTQPSTVPASDMNTPAAPGFGPVGPVTPSLPADSGMNTPASPGFGPVGPVTPSLPANSGDTPAAPGFGPVGPVTPSLSANSGHSGGHSGSCVNCGNGLINTILWAWGVNPPSSTISTVSHVRFYNAAAIREPIDIYLNNRLVVSDLDYMNYTRYLHIVPGNYLLTIFRRTNPATPIVNNRVQFQSGAYYILSVLGGPEDYSVQLVSS